MATPEMRGGCTAGAFKPAWWLTNPHLQTVLGALVRRGEVPYERRVRLELEDGDFLDIDLAGAETRVGAPLVVVTHGLEGSSHDAIVLSVARECVRRGWGIVAWNLRGCSGEPNRLARAYHSGSTDDLEAVLRFAREIAPLSPIGLVGFSLGGNITLRYLGEQGEKLASGVFAGVGVSVPCDLEACAKALAQPRNAFYMGRFSAAMRPKIRAKHRKFPGQLRNEALGRLRTFEEIDRFYTAPLNGFLDERDYWRRASCKAVLQEIKRPTLLLSAQDDPFLTAECFPHETVANHPFLCCEWPKRGGHLGFLAEGKAGSDWLPRHICEFLAENQLPVANA